MKYGGILGYYRMRNLMIYTEHLVLLR